MLHSHSTSWTVNATISDKHCVDNCNLSTTHAHTNTRTPRYTITHVHTFHTSRICWFATVLLLTRIYFPTSLLVYCTPTHTHTKRLLFFKTGFFSSGVACDLMWVVTQQQAWHHYNMHPSTHWTLCTRANVTAAQRKKRATQLYDATYELEPMIWFFIVTIVDCWTFICVWGLGRVPEQKCTLHRCWHHHCQHWYTIEMLQPLTKITKS